MLKLKTGEILTQAQFRTILMFSFDLQSKDFSEKQAFIEVIWCIEEVVPISFFRFWFLCFYVFGAFSWHRKPA